MPSIGRAEMKSEGDLGLPIVDPEQYCGAIVARIASESAATAARFGSDYAARIDGLEGRVRRVRASLSEVLLYLPIRTSVQAKD